MVNILYIMFFVAIRLSPCSGAVDHVFVQVNGFELKFNASDSAQLVYNGIYKYEYEEGDFMDFNCNRGHNRGELGLTYYEANGNKVFERLPSADGNQLRFQQTMQASHNGSYVDCTYTIISSEDYHQQELKNRTIFILTNRTSRNSGFVVIINGVKLTPQKSDNYRDYYQYMYFNGLQLDVTCKMTDKEVDGTIRLDVTRTYTYTREHMSNNTNVIIRRESPESHMKDEYRVFLQTKDIDGYCLNFDVQEKSAQIQLLVEPDRELVVLGLPESGVLYQYNENREKWVTHYHYTNNEALELTCMTTANRNPYWDFKSELKPLKEGNISENSGVRFVNATFFLNATHDLKNITCASKMNKTTTQEITIVFQGRSKLQPNKIINKAHNGRDKSDSSPIIYVGYAIAALVVIVAAIWGFRWYTQKRNTSNRERASQNIYEDPIPPFPSQWETNGYCYIVNDCHRNEKNDNEYTYIRNENVCNKDADGEILDNEIYLKTKEPCYAVPHNNIATYSGPSEHHYTEIDKKNINTTIPEYSVPNKQDYIKNVPSTSTNTYSNCQTANNTKNLNREDSTSFSNLLTFDSDKTYVNLKKRDSIK